MKEVILGIALERRYGTVASDLGYGSLLSHMEQNLFVECL